MIFNTLLRTLERCKTAAFSPIDLENSDMVSNHQSLCFREASSADFGIYTSNGMTVTRITYRAVLQPVGVQVNEASLAELKILHNL